MNTAQLHQYMMKDPIISLMYGGTLAKNQLPPHPLKTPKIYIVNQQNSHQPGNHWIVLWIDVTSEYFDSLGKEPPIEFRQWLSLKETPFMFNSKRLQDINSDLCGQYCLMYSYFRSRGVTFQDFVDMFDQKLFLNDVKAKYFYDLTV